MPAIVIASVLNILNASIGPIRNFAPDGLARKPGGCPMGRPFTVQLTERADVGWAAGAPGPAGWRISRSRGSPISPT
jgi:hypothetical protein